MFRDLCLGFFMAQANPASHAGFKNRITLNLDVLRSLEAWCADEWNSEHLFSEERAGQPQMTFLGPDIDADRDNIDVDSDLDVNTDSEPTLTSTVTPTLTPTMAQRLMSTVTSTSTPTATQTLKLTVTPTVTHCLRKTSCVCRPWLSVRRSCAP